MTRDSADLTANLIRALPDYVCAAVLFICGGMLIIGFAP